eukprot:scaffold24174_cov117-Cylindrotheca_fusiformis.AAC.5
MASTTSFLDIVGTQNGIEPSYRRGFEAFVYYLRQDSSAKVFSSLPRFGHTPDISLLFSKNSEDQDDFLLGLVPFATLVMTFFTLWLMAIWFLKCLGPDRVGVFAGHPFETGPHRLTLGGRGVYALSSLMIIIFTILFMSEGLGNLQISLDTIEETNREIISIHDQLFSVVGSLKEEGGRAETMRVVLEDVLKRDLCPLRPTSEIATTIRFAGQSTLDTMDSLSGFVDRETEGLFENLKVLELTTASIDDTLAGTSLTGTTPTLLVSLLSLLTLCLVVALVLGWFEVFSEPYYFLVTWFILPTFTLLVIASFVGAGAMAMLAQANSDLCLGGAEQSPESSIRAILEQQDISEFSMYYETVVFYSSQCQERNPWKLLEDFYADVYTAKEKLDTFSDTLSQIPEEQLRLGCGFSFDPLLELLDRFSTHATELLDIGKQAEDLVKCDTIVPLYIRLVHTATCDSSVYGAKWCFVSLLMISFFGMILITLRGAYYPMGYYYEDDGKRLADDAATNSDEVLSLNTEEEYFISESQIDDDVYEEAEHEHSREAEGER